MIIDAVHQFAPLFDHTPLAVLGDQLASLGAAQPTPPPPGGGGPDFSNIQPNSKGVPKSGVLITIGEVLLYFGLGISFLVFAGAIVVWIAGHMAGGMHVSQNAKTNMLRAGFGGVFLTAAGAIWTWLTTNV